MRSFAVEARTVTRLDDPNLAALVGELADIAAEAEAQGIGDDDVCNRCKVLIFSCYADTVDWVYEHLVGMTETDERLAPYRDRIASLSGTTGTDADGDVIDETLACLDKARPPAGFDTPRQLAADCPNGALRRGPMQLRQICCWVHVLRLV